MRLKTRATRGRARALGIAGSSPRRQPARARPRSRPEAELAALLKARGTHGWVEEYRFHPERKWRFDFAWPLHKVALEIEGGIWSGGRHTRGAGYAADCEKYNEAALAGWLVLRVPVTGCWKTTALHCIDRALLARSGVTA